MRVIIVEDELPSSRRLYRMLKKFNYEVVTSLVSIKSTVKWLNENKHPDIIFLDIHLSDGLCFEIFEQVNIQSLVVFTTAFSQYSIKAFDYNSISYLLKPIKEEQLAKAIDKATTFSKKEKELIVLRDMLEIESLSDYKNQFIVRVGKKIRIIESEQISCFYSSNNATYLRKNTSNYIVNSSLSQLEYELNPKLFFKVNRRTIINKTAIKEIQTYKNSRLKISLHVFDDSEIIVSRERTKDFKLWLNN